MDVVASFLRALKVYTVGTKTKLIRIETRIERFKSTE